MHNIFKFLFSVENLSDGVVSMKKGLLNNGWLIGKVEKYILKKIEKEGALHLTLIDPEYDSVEYVEKIVKICDECGTDAFLVGGSLGVGASSAEKVMEAIKNNTEKPVIIFPGNVDNVAAKADAIFFMSLLNSRNSYWISGAQALGAPIIKKLGIEPIPMAYIIIEPGGTVSFIGDAKPIPRKKPDIAAAYALAGQYLGMRLIYLEAGSGAKEPVDEKMVATVSKVVDVPIIVGGGIKKAKVAGKLVKAGADIIVTGTIVEEIDDGEKLKKEMSKLIEVVKKEGEKKV